MPGGRPKTRTEPDAVKSVIQGARHSRAPWHSARGPASVSDIARATGFNVSTAFRQLQTLVRRGYVEQDPGHRGYVMGPRLYQLASGYLKGQRSRCSRDRISKRCAMPSAKRLTW